MTSEPPRIKTTALTHNEEYCPVAIYNPLTSFHHCFQFLIIGHRYLLMNLHLVQFQYSFELMRLAYPHFAQTFEDIM